MPHWIFNLSLVFGGYFVGAISGFGLSTILRFEKWRDENEQNKKQ